MLPLPLILVVVMAGMTMLLVFLLFQQLGKDRRDLGRHKYELADLEEDIAQRDGDLKKLNALKIKLLEENQVAQKELEKTKKELGEKERLYQELKARFSQFQQEIGANKDVVVQLEQQKKQFMDQLIKYKKLEKDLHAKQDEVAALEQKNKGLLQENERLKNELGKNKEEAEQGKVRQEESPFSRFLKPKINLAEQAELPEEEHKSTEPT